MSVPQLGFGVVHHARLRPVQHAFGYPALFLLLPMRSWRAQPAASPLARNRFAPIAFHDRDHGDGRGDALAWLDELLHREGVTDAGGEVWLQCFPRVFGYAFKPVSFWYCHRADGHLAAIVAEVNNTFGERHCYLLDAPDWGRELQARKDFHVSPFCRVEGRYRFRFLASQAWDRIVARIDHDDDRGLLLATRISGEAQPATRALLWLAALRFPLHGLVLVARIHWQALRLALKRVPFTGKPPAPDRIVTRSP